MPSDELELPEVVEKIKNGVHQTHLRFVLLWVGVCLFVLFWHGFWLFVIFRVLCFVWWGFFVVLFCLLYTPSLPQRQNNYH